MYVATKTAMKLERFHQPVGDRTTLIGRFHDDRGETLAGWAEEGSIASRDVEVVPLSD